MGSNHLEAAQIISIGEHLKELSAAYATIVPRGSEPTEDQLNTWFDTGSTDASGAADRAGYATRYLQWWLGRIENSLGSKGFAVGDKLSLADLYLYNALAEHLSEEQAKEGLSASRKAAFASKERTDALVAKYPKIQASINAVAANANHQKWLSIRGVQGF
jgi:glutathione S-transferase